MTKTFATLTAAAALMATSTIVSADAGRGLELKRDVQVEPTMGTEIRVQAEAPNSALSGNIYEQGDTTIVTTFEADNSRDREEGKYIR